MRLPPSQLCQAAAGGDTEGGPVHGLGTKQARLSVKSPCKSPFLLGPHAPLTPTDSWGNKNSPVKKSAEPSGKSGTGKEPLRRHSDWSRARKWESQSHEVDAAVFISGWCPRFWQSKKADFPRMCCLAAECQFTDNYFCLSQLQMIWTTISSV